MTTTDIAMPALPGPRRQVLHLPTRLELERRPAGRYAAEVNPHDAARNEAEGIALARGEDAAYRHGRRCACCRAAAPAVEAAC